MKRIIIIGATSGIGRSIAEYLALEGYKVGVAGRNTEVLKTLQQRHPDNIVWERIDITAHDATKTLARLINRNGGMDTYIHVAGSGFRNSMLEPEKEDITLQTNVDGFTRMIDAAFNYFRHKNGGKGHIAAITSVAATNGIGDLAAYSASKRYQQTYLCAIDQLSRSNKLKIRITDIRPGWIDTPLLLPDHRYPMLMTTSYATRLIIRAIRRRKRVAIIDWRWNLLVGLWRLLPNRIWTHLNIKVGPIASRTTANNT